MKGGMLAAVMTLLTTPAIASGVLPFDGAFGNPAGCQFYNHGGTPAEDFMLLTPDTFAGRAALCDFETPVSSSKGVFTVAAVCQGAGDGREGMDQIEVIDHGADGYGIKFEDVAEWGPWPACPPSDVETGQPVVNL